MAQLLLRRLDESFKKRRRVTGSSEPDISEESDDEGSPAPASADPRGEKVVRLVKRRTTARHQPVAEDADNIPELADRCRNSPALGAMAGDTGRDNLAEENAEEGEEEEEMIFDDDEASSRF
jgi:hypothetical protein